MSRWWKDEGLQQFVWALNEHGRVSQYPYQAFLFTGELRDYCVNAQLVEFRGELCRLVEHLL